MATYSVLLVVHMEAEDDSEAYDYAQEVLESTMENLSQVKACWTDFVELWED